MPIVSINLNDEAYGLYKEQMKVRNGSRFVSAAIINYRMKEEYLPMLKDGDRRTSISGDDLVWWEGKGWVVEE
tara:strand:- start:465 stop:683 length:219 start_codon:yes stop_codon:yes gene_type:complete